MILYLSIIFVFSVGLACIDIFAVNLPYEAWLVVLMIVGAVAFQFLVDALTALLVHVLPKKWFSPNNKFFHVSKKEQHFYDKIKIKIWKDYVWELGSLGGFSKSKVAEPTNKDYYETFLVESNKGLLNHYLGCLMGFLLLLVLPSDCLFAISLPVAIVNLLMNLPSIMILRYNIPKLYKVYQILSKKEQRKPVEVEENDEEMGVATKV